jgi:hypothetical protein
MATDLTLYLDDQPGELARVGDVLGKAGANIGGLCALTTGGGQAEVHILVQDPTAAFQALQDAGITIAAECAGRGRPQTRRREGQPHHRVSGDQHAPGARGGQPPGGEVRAQLEISVSTIL